MADKTLYHWKETFDIANDLKSKLEPHCEPDRCMIVGSLRRECAIVHDIDIVLSPLPGQLLPFQSMQLAYIMGEGWQYLKGKEKIINGLYWDIPVDLYFATQEQWWTLVVIRTGSKEHNIKLCSRAKARGMKLHADGSGIEREDGTYLVPDGEEDIFGILGLAYLEPKDR